MSRPGWYSQPYPPEGAGAAEGIRKQLGKPELDLLTILVRESAQNSWDARVTDSIEPVDYRIDLWTVGPAHAAAWRELLLPGAPNSAENFPLRNTLRNGVVRILAVSDRGTRGLGGPTRADDAVGLERDFVSFVRNIGEPRDKAYGGGTYGFGKGIFYLISRAGTVLIHTRCRLPGGGFETRLIGCTMWQSYVSAEGDGGRRYTGRHWWGDVTGDVVEPLIGVDAERTAHRLGLKPFAADETGTTVAVLDPHLDEHEPASAAEYLAETISWHLWPKMIATEGRGPSMRFTVTCDGLEHTVPDPRTTRPLNMFVAAYEAAIGSKGLPVACKKPTQHLGRLGLVKRIMPAMESTPASRMVEIHDMVHHVCLMRPAELVVTYHPGPKPPSTNQGYAGVFRADEAMDDVFAKAEPPTHDAWNAHSLDGHERTYVRTAFRRIKEYTDDLLALQGSARPGASSVSLGGASSFFSGLVGGAWGVGGATAYSKADGSGRLSNPKRKKTSSRTSTGSDPDVRQGAEDDHGHAQDGDAATGGTAARRRPRVQYVGDPYYGERGGTDVLVQEFRLPVPGPQTVRSDLGVILPGTGGRETDPPIGASRPTLLGWEDPAGNLHDADPLVVEGDAGTVWRAVVRPAPDTMTEIGIKVEAVRAE